MEIEPIEMRHRFLCLFFRRVDYCAVASIVHSTGHAEIRSENVSGVTEEFFKVQRPKLRRPIVHVDRSSGELVIWRT